MRKTLGFVSALALMAGLAATAAGPGGTGRTFSPVSTAEAASVLRQQAINGSSNYAVIAPTFIHTGAAAPESYIRLYNGAGAANSMTISTFSITLVGNNTGNIYGSTFTVGVTHEAVVQLSMGDLAAKAGTALGSLAGGDTSFSVYIQNPDKEAGYMHAVYDWGSTLFEDMSMCDTNINEQMVALHNEMVLTSIHTNKVAAFPSTIRIHNYYNVPITYAVSVFNADSGALICKIPTTVKANTTAIIPESTIEATAGCGGAATPTYLNVVIADQSGGAPNAVVSHTVFVSNLNGSTSLTAACAVNHLDTSSGGGGVVISPYT